MPSYHDVNPQYDAPADDAPPPPQILGHRGEIMFHSGICQHILYALGNHKKLMFISAPFFVIFFAAYLADYHSMTGDDAATASVFLTIVGSIAIFIVLHVGVLLHHRRHKNRINHEEDQREREYDNALYNWHESRPLTRIANAPEPLRALRARINNTDVYAGVNKYNQNMATVPRDYPVLVLGPTRYGKTTFLSQPMHVAHIGALISVSTKRDTFDATWAVRQSLGRVWFFDPFGEADDAALPAGIVRAVYSPLMSCKTWSDSMMTATQMVAATPAGAPTTDVSATHWRVSTEMLLAPLLFAAYLHQDLDMTNVRKWILQKKFSEPLAILRAVERDETHPNAVEAPLALEALTSSLQADDRHFSSVISVAVTVMRVYLHTSVATLTGSTNFDVDAFVRSADTVYINATSEHQSEVSPLIVALLVAIQRATYRLNQVEPFMSSSRPSVLAILDEAANAARMKDLPKYVTEGGGQGFQLVVMLQTPDQAVEAWPIQGKSFRSYFPVKIALGGLDDDQTLEALSVLTGDAINTYRQTSMNRGESHGGSTGSSSGWSGGALSGQHNSSSSVGENWSYSYSESNSTSQVKERRLSPGDISSLQMNEALIHGPGKWAVIDLVGVFDDRWQRIIASTPPARQLDMEPPLLSEHGTRSLPPVSQLVRYERDRLTPATQQLDPVSSERDPES